MLDRRLQENRMFDRGRAPTSRRCHRREDAPAQRANESIPNRDRSKAATKKMAILHRAERLPIQSHAESLAKLIRACARRRLESTRLPARPPGTQIAPEL